LTLPSKFYVNQPILTKDVVRRSDLLSFDDDLLYSGDVFVIRNEAWEPYLSHSANISKLFGIETTFDYSIYDDALFSFPKKTIKPILIWINWDRVFSTEKYLEKLRLVSIDQKHKILIVVPNLNAEKFKLIQNFIQNNCPWIEIIYSRALSKLNNKEESGYSKEEVSDIITKIGKNIIPTLFYPIIKTIIIDLDETLYSGILGEDGIYELKVTNAHKDLQTRLKYFFDKGILLNIVSKNNTHEVEDLLKNDRIVSIPKSNFTFIHTNWDNKSISVEKILENINIDQESAVFIDDNPRELLEISMRYPRMLLINASITKDLNKILNLEIFNRRNNEVISNTDRSNDIIANQKRRNILENSLNEESSLLSIGTELMSKFASTKEELQRAEELFQKTNQFNFSNKRSKIQKMTKTNASKVIITKLSDSFSDSGIIASMMYDSKKNKPIVIKEFVISCRALGRGLEKYILKSMLALISRQKIKKIGNEIFFDWNETDRNIPAQKFIEDIGMIDNLTPKKLLLEPSKLAINDLFDKVIND